MRGAKIDISAEAFFETIGFDLGDIQVIGAEAGDSPNSFKLLLASGEDDRLPEANPGLQWPKATMICTRNEDGSVTSVIKECP